MAKRGANHTRVQREGRNRDLYTCQICGFHENTEGHHLIDYQYGGAADVRNIITLCRMCHKEVHRGNIDLMLF